MAEGFHDGDGWSVNKQTSSCDDNHGASSRCGELRIGAGAAPRRPSTVEQSRAVSITIHACFLARHQDSPVCDVIVELYTGQSSRLR